MGTIGVAAPPLRHRSAGLARGIGSLVPAALVTGALFLLMAQLIAPQDVPQPARGARAMPSIALPERPVQVEQSRVILSVDAPAPGEAYTPPPLWLTLGKPDPPDLSSIEPPPVTLSMSFDIVFGVPKPTDLDLVEPAFAACFAPDETEAVIRLLYDVDREGYTRNVRVRLASNDCVAAYAVCDLSTWYQPTRAGATDLEAGYIIARDEMVTRGSTCAEAAAL